MARPSEDPRGEPPLTALVKDIVEGLGALVAAHVKLARVELEASAKSYGKHIALFALAGAFTVLGYALGCIAGALALARAIGGPLAFLAVGGVHLAGASVALVVLVRRSTPPPLGETLSQLDHTVSMLSSDTRAAERAIATPPPQERSALRAAH